MVTFGDTAMLPWLMYFYISILFVTFWCILQWQGTKWMWRSLSEGFAIVIIQMIKLFAFFFFVTVIFPGVIIIIIIIKRLIIKCSLLNNNNIQSLIGSLSKIFPQDRTLTILRQNEIIIIIDSNKIIR